MPQLLHFTLSHGCQNGTGFIKLESFTGAPVNADRAWRVLDSNGQDFGTSFGSGSLPTAGGLADETYTVSASADDGTYAYNSGEQTVVIACVGTPGALVLDSLSHTDETAAGHDGTATIQASGGVAPLTARVVELSLTQSATSGQPVTLGPLPASDYTVQITDSSTPPVTVGGPIEVRPYTAPVTGCLDEYATNYDPLATVAGACSYAPTWRSAWGPAGVAVPVAAVAGQTAAYIEASLRIGFRPGHPLAEFRPLGEALKLRATVAPNGYAVFRLGPYLRPQLGAADGEGGYRLDINEQTVDDFYVGYELRRSTGELLEHGYALYAARPDAELVEGTVLTAFERVPTWPGYSWKRAQLRSSSAGRYATIAEVYLNYVTLPCPPNPLPVAWLNPQGGWDYWVFQGRPLRGDSTDEGQTYTEAGTGQRRYSERGATRRTVKTTSGVFKGEALLAGLRTLWASPQAWYQPTPSSDWVAITIEGGQRDVGRMGVLRNELAISFTEAAPQYVQGQ